LLWQSARYRIVGYVLQEIINRVGSPSADRTARNYNALAAL